jgi:hypothetical protein
LVHTISKNLILVESPATNKTHKLLENAPFASKMPQKKKNGRKTEGHGAKILCRIAGKQ